MTAARRALASVLFAIAVGVGTAAAKDIEFGHGEIWIESANGRHHFTVEVADTEARRERGLMFRKAMAQDAGMLFDFGQEMLVAMWMKNTFIPLDMLFVDGKGVIRRIAESTTPLSLESIFSGAPVRAVIELNGGVTRRLGIRRGNRVRHGMFAGQ